MYAVEMIVVMLNGEPTNGKSDKHKKKEAINEDT